LPPNPRQGYRAYVHKPPEEVSRSRSLAAKRVWARRKAEREKAAKRRRGRRANVVELKETSER
jgi:hypothetical protein